MWLRGLYHLTRSWHTPSKLPARNILMAKKAKPKVEYSRVRETVFLEFKDWIREYEQETGDPICWPKKDI